MQTDGLRSSSKVKLWSNNVWLICFSHLFLSISLYMLVPTLPIWLVQNYGADAFERGLILGISGLSIYAFGPFFNYLVDRFPRKSVCIWGILGVAFCSLGFYWAPFLLWVLILRILQGIMHGIALMASGSTLAIDLTVSPRRTDANNAFAWFGRLGLSIGPVIGLLMLHSFNFQILFVASFVIGLMAVICIWSLKVPFRAPLCPPICSIDRFWLPNGWLMLIQTILVSAGIGFLLAVISHYEFYVFMMVGFCIALLALNFVFFNADIRSEVVSGNILWGAGLLLLIYRQSTVSFYSAAILIGLGIGLTVSRILVFFIKLSHHCERGSANTTYFFSWELGIGIGLFLGCTLCSDAIVNYQVCLWLLVLALMFYLLVTHRWFMKHKVR